LEELGFPVSSEDVRPDKIGDYAYVPGTSEHNNYKSTFDNPQSTEKDKEIAYQNALREFTNNMTVDLKLKVTLLEDIRSGRANMWQ
jgi:hypothetical protein